MKREPIPTLEQVAEVVRRVDLSRLNNRLVGKALVEFEHCLVEVLGALIEGQKIFRAVRSDIAQDAYEASTGKAFMDAYIQYKKEGGAWMEMHANFSPTGRYFQMLLDRLNDKEDKQAHAGKAVTVAHARMLAAMIVRELESMYGSGQQQNEKLEGLWRHWVNQPLPAYADLQA